MRNIVLTGLSGCGKTTLGRRLAEALELPFLDMDTHIEEGAGMVVREIFDRFGEAHFRQLEALAARQAAELRGAVISTGGGVVLRQDNIQQLRRTGLVVFLDRSPEAIVADVACEGRPLLTGGAEKLYELARQRRPLYLGTAHVVFENVGDADSAFPQLLELVKEHLEPQG